MSAKSYWQNKTEITIPWYKPKTDKFDFIIIGGGLSGLSLAYWIEQIHPASKVAIIEQHTCAWGASGRNAGFLTKGSFYYLNKLIEIWGESTAKLIWKFSADNAELLRSHFDLSIQNDFQKQGSLTFCDQKLSNETLKIYDDLALKYLVVSKSDLESRFHLNSFKTALWDPQESSINPIELLKAIFQKLKNTVFINDRVTGFTEDSTELEKNGALIFKHMFLANHTGITECSNSSLKFEEALNEVVLTKPISEDFPGNYYDSNHMGYFRQTACKRLIIGGYRLKPENSIEEKIRKYLEPSLTLQQALEFEYQWKGYLNLSETNIPHVENLGDNLNISVFSGFSGHGLGLIFKSANIAVENLGEKYSLSQKWNIKSN